MQVQDVMTKNPITARPDETVTQVEIRMRAADIRRVPVMSGSRLIGIVSELDIRNCQEPLESVRVRKIMTPKPVTIEPSATLEHAVSLLMMHEIGALPVVEHDRLIGIVTAKDLWLREPRPLPEWAPSIGR